MQNGFTCQCPFGVTGQFCDVVIDLCNSNPCQNGGICSRNGFSSLICICRSGYTGAMCEQTINLCLNRPCLNGGTCIQQGIGFQCECPSGFTDQICGTQLNPCQSSPCFQVDISFVLTFLVLFFKSCIFYQD
jgi:hypothetical protein